MVPYKNSAFNSEKGGYDTPFNKINEEEISTKKKKRFWTVFFQSKTWVED